MFRYRNNINGGFMLPTPKLPVHVPAYSCGVCVATGVKLWAFEKDPDDLRCLEHMKRDIGLDLTSIRRNGRCQIGSSLTNCFGDYSPAIAQADGTIVVDLTNADLRRWERLPNKIITPGK